MEFLFTENDFFTNEKLVKSYRYDENFDSTDRRYFDSEGCEIHWKPGKSLLTKVEVKKQTNRNTGETRTLEKEIAMESFFEFFNPPQREHEAMEDLDEEVAMLLSEDFALGEKIKDVIIPQAVRWFTGEAEENDFSEEEEINEEEEEEKLATKNYFKEGGKFTNEDDDESEDSDPEFNPDDEAKGKRPAECKQQ